MRYRQGTGALMGLAIMFSACVGSAVRNQPAVRASYLYVEVEPLMGATPDVHIYCRGQRVESFRNVIRKEQKRIWGGNCGGEITYMVEMNRGRSAERHYMRDGIDAFPCDKLVIQLNSPLRTTGFYVDIGWCAYESTGRSRTGQERDGQVLAQRLGRMAGVR